jgi:uncharacterized phiE125 gp8 family phage protein
MSVWTFQRKTAPALLVVDLPVLKEHVRIDVDSSEEDTALGIYHDAAVQWIEEYTGRSLVTQTWQLSAQAFPHRLWLPRSVPLASVTFVKYYNDANTLTTLSSSVYTVPSFWEPACLTLASGQTWPAIYSRDDAVQVEYVTGATTVDLVPAALRQAVQLLVGHWYAHREDVVVGTSAQQIPMAVESLCAPFKLRVRPPQWVAA